MKPLIDVPVSTLPAGTKFAMTREGWGRDYGTKFGKVLYQGPGSTRVRWFGEPKTNEFTDSRTGKHVAFTTDGSRDENISPSTEVQIESKR